MTEPRRIYDIIILAYWANILSAQKSVDESILMIFFLEKLPVIIKERTSKFLFVPLIIIVYIEAYVVILYPYDSL